MVSIMEMAFIIIEPIHLQLYVVSELQLSYCAYLPPGSYRFDAGSCLDLTLVFHQVLLLVPIPCQKRCSHFALICITGLSSLFSVLLSLCSCICVLTSEHPCVLTPSCPHIPASFSHRLHTLIRLFSLFPSCIAITSSCPYVSQSSHPYVFQPLCRFVSPPSHNPSVPLSTIPPPL